jgi:hypothetical protein
MDIVLHPTYFPGISHCIGMAGAASITFEVCDNFQKQTYRNRTYIYGANGRLLLNIPVIHTQRDRKLYRDVKIANNNRWQDIHWKSIQSAYRASPFFEFYKDDLRPLFQLKAVYLMDFNFRCLEKICHCLEWNMEFEKTTEYQKVIKDKIDLRDLVNAKKEQEFHFSHYTQVFSGNHGFIGNLSILDLLFNEGPNTLHYLQSQKLGV